MRILHTSDWHLGKQLKKVSLAEDMALFFEELVQIIREERVDVLLMSGDLFDLAHPPQHALHQYFDLLRTLQGLDRRCTIILTGGNHDSPTVLEGPSNLLSLLDIHIIGGARENPQDYLIPIERNGERILIAAMPYLRDRDVRKATAGEDYADKIAQYRSGVEELFEAVNQLAEELYPDWPLITMAHLYAQGGQISDSERQIQMGNEASIPATLFGTRPTYVALGHLHRPQIVGKNDRIRYSGSPIALSFSEREDAKEVVMLEVDNGTVDIYTRPLKTHRKLVRIAGSMRDVETQLATYRGAHKLPDLLELQVEEQQESAEALRWLRGLEEVVTDQNYRIVHKKISFQHRIEGTGSMMTSSDEISNYTELELFNKRLEAEKDWDDEMLDEMRRAFLEVLEKIDQT